MAKRYRTFKRVRMTRRSAEAIKEAMVDRTFNAHFAMVCSKCSKDADPNSNHCKNCGFDTLKQRKHYSCEHNTCVHVTSRTLDCARLIEANTKISKTKAYVDLPGEDADLLRLVAKRLRDFAKGKTASAFLRVAEAAENHARRGWLHLLAECALDVDGEELHDSN